MEGLLQALASEKKAGQFFRKYVQKSGNEVKYAVKFGLFFIPKVTHCH